jgi:galactitol-specific phosphotransferase system IIC component
MPTLHGRSALWKSSDVLMCLMLLIQVLLVNNKLLKLGELLAWCLLFVLLFNLRFICCCVITKLVNILQM